MFRADFSEKDETFAAVFDGGRDDFSADFTKTVEIDRGAYHFGSGLLYEKSTNTVSVDAADSVSARERRPVTANAVAVEVGNIEVLLKTI